jgi:glycosyl transferase family 2
MNEPLVTVLMAVYNASRYLGEAIDSALVQTHRNLELLIIDDGSTDDSHAIAASYPDSRIRILKNEANLGLTASLNRGLRVASGEFVARQDADDVSHSERLRRQVEVLAAEPDVALVGCPARLVDSEGRALGKLDVPLDLLSIRWAQMFDNSFIHSAVMFRKSIILGELGGYDESFRISQDYDLWSKVIRRHSARNLGEHLLNLRVHQASMMRTQHTELDEETRRIITANVKATLPRMTFSDEDVGVLCRFRSQVGPDVFERFHELFGRMLSEYSRMYPEAAASGSFRETVARQYARIGYNLLPGHRGLAFREFKRAFATYPATVFQLPWTRIAALCLLGDNARSVYLRLAQKKHRKEAAAAPSKR